jgi:signal peptidase I
LRNRCCATPIDKFLKPAVVCVETLGMTSSNGGNKGARYGPLRVSILLVAGLALLACTTTAVAVVVLHLAVRPVMSGSMRPTYDAGAVLFTKPVPVTSLRPGMIIVFVPPGEHVEFAHRITSVSGSAADPIVTTKGDANKAPDPWQARLTTATVPVVVATQPWIGRLMVGLRGPIQMVFIIVGGLLVAISGSLLILRPQRPTSTSFA